MHTQPDPVVTVGDHAYPLSKVLSEVHALTLRNPWAAAVAHGGKDENRSWDPNVSWLLIHAGARWDPNGVAACADRGAPNIEQMVVPSSIVALAHISGVCRPDTPGCCTSRWAVPGEYHILFDRVVALPGPVPAKGKQRLWWPNRDTLTAVRDSLVKALHRVQLVCNGRRLNPTGTASMGQPCGAIHTGDPGQSAATVEAIATNQGWRLGPPTDVPRHVMCPACSGQAPRGRVGSIVRAV